VPTIDIMSDQPVETSGNDTGAEPGAVTAPTEKRIRRTMLSTGFSDVPGKSCEICGFQGFRWQSECPQGHPLS
jgi:hypothetical protein